MKKILGILIIIVGFFQVASAQEIDWSISLGQNKITIGDQVEVKFTAVNPKDAFITFSLEGQSEKNKIEILNTQFDTIFGENNSITVINQTFTIGAYHPGEYSLIPSIAYFYADETVSTKEEGKTLSLTVSTIDIDTALDIKDIQPIRKEPLHFSEIFPYLIAVIILAGLIILGIYLWRRYQKKEPILKIFSKPKIPYYQIALENMEILRQKNLWQNDRIKEYYTELIDIFKYYIYKHYHIQAAEMTSDEMIQALSSNKQVPKEFLPNIKYMLTNSDLVKFAKSIPLPDEHDRAFQIVLDFIKQTMPVLETENKKEEK